MPESPAPSSRTPAAIILAAGLSSRMGTFKPLLNLHGKPLIHHVLDSLVAGGGGKGDGMKIIVVTGHQSHLLESALEPLTCSHPITLIHNPQYATGEMLSSLRAGLAALPLETPAFLLAFADQPAVSSDTIRRLLATWHSTRPHPPLILPTFLGNRGHPVVLSSTLIPEIRALPEGDSLKTVVHRHLASALLLPVDDHAVLEDLDTPDDFARTQNAWPAQPVSAAAAR